MKLGVILLGGASKARGDEAGMELLRRGSEPPSHQIGGLGSAANSPAGFGAESRPPNDFSIRLMR